MKIYRVLGKDGTATIPYALRQALGFQPGNVVSFEQTGNGILVRKEPLMRQSQVKAGNEAITPTLPKSLEEFLESLSAKDQYDALVQLSVLWARRQEEVRK